MPDELLTVDEAARRFGISRRSIFKLLAEAQLIRYRRAVTRQTLVDPAELDRVLKPRPER